MGDDLLAKQIRQAALDAGFEGCGIVPISELAGYAEKLAARESKAPQSSLVYRAAEEFPDIPKNYPWARSIVVCSVWLGKYRFPASLQGKYAKAFLLSSDSAPDEFKETLRFERWMRDAGIRFEGGAKNAPVKILPLRHCAVTAGLGIFRKNNFFYGEKGSYYTLEGYLIDRACDLRESHDIRPCSDRCGLCQKACKTRALFEPFSMNPLSCVSFWTTFGGGVVPPHLKEEQFEEWICGCDACQDVCPHNRRDWNTGEDFPGLNDLTELLQPQNIVDATDETLRQRIVPKTESHITEEQVETLRVAARRALRFSTDDR